MLTTSRYVLNCPTRPEGLEFIKTFMSDQIFLVRIRLLEAIELCGSKRISALLQNNRLCIIQLNY